MIPTDNTTRVKKTVRVWFWKAEHVKKILENLNEHNHLWIRVSEPEHAGPFHKEMQVVLEYPDSCAFDLMFAEYFLTALKTGLKAA